MSKTTGTRLTYDELERELRRANDVIHLMDEGQKANETMHNMIVGSLKREIEKLKGKSVPPELEDSGGG